MDSDHTNMQSLIFESRFVPLIMNGSKSTTISENTSRLYVGDVVQFKFKRKKPPYFRVFYKAKITRRSELTIYRTRAFMGRPVKQRKMFAINDGFESWGELVEWFDLNYYLPFYGVQLEWTPIIPT